MLNPEQQHWEEVGPADLDKDRPERRRQRLSRQYDVPTFVTHRATGTECARGLAYFLLVSPEVWGSLIARPKTTLGPP
jgi:hypothetical protein